MLRIWWVMICHEYSQLIQTVVITWERSSFEIQGNTWQFQLCCDLGGECQWHLMNNDPTALNTLQCTGQSTPNKESLVPSINGVEAEKPYLKIRA